MSIVTDPDRASTLYRAATTLIWVIVERAAIVERAGIVETASSLLRAGIVETASRLLRAGIVERASLAFTGIVERARRLVT